MSIRKKLAACACTRPTRLARTCSFCMNSGLVCSTESSTIPAKSSARTRSSGLSRPGWSPVPQNSPKLLTARAIAGLVGTSLIIPIHKRTIRRPSATIKGTPMTSQQAVSQTRALVLGGGGAVGIGWQVGILTGLRAAGVDFTGNEEILGTSAGSLVGAQLSSGRDVTNAFAVLASLGESIDPAAMAAGNDAFLSAMSQANLGNDSAQF